MQYLSIRRVPKPLSGDDQSDFLLMDQDNGENWLGGTVGRDWCGAGLLEGKPAWLKVLDTVAEMGDWTGARARRRVDGRGIAIHECFGTIVGEVAEITVSAKV